MLLVLQLALYCLLFFLLVRLGAGNSSLNELYFYPKEVQERAFEIGLATREETARKCKRFMIPFLLVLFVALVLIIGLWNNVGDFKTAYWQAVLFLVVMNWFDGIVIDKLWVGYSKFWLIPELKEIPYVKSWREVLIKRGAATAIYVVLAAVPAELAILLNALVR